MLHFPHRVKVTAAFQLRCRPNALTWRNMGMCSRPRAITLRPSGLMRCESPGRRRGIHSFLVPPLVFGGLVVTLWTWKCLMMIIFQNKIIYMPGLPPNARREKIEDYKNQCGGVIWREEEIKSLDGTPISLCVASVENSVTTLPDLPPLKTVYILYFQGNASSLPPRLPFLSPVLQILKQRAFAANLPIKYVLVCCSYRGYWTSSGRPSEKGIALDALASLQWITAQVSSSQEPVPLIIWGQSIGTGVASKIASKIASGLPPSLYKNLSLQTLILETPFLSIRAMLETLYPQKWLPYRYLGPFLWNHLDSEKALGAMNERLTEEAKEKVPRVLILQAGKDELVPREHGERLEEVCVEAGIEVERKVIGGALHTEVLVKGDGVKAVVDGVEQVAREACEI